MIYENEEDGEQIVKQVYYSRQTKSFEKFFFLKAFKVSVIVVRVRGLQWGDFGFF